jgi:glycosyltransferase involved in cell wall biosynthesis
VRVLIISQYFAPESFCINALAEALQRSGQETTVLTGQPNYPEGRIYPGYRAWRGGKEVCPSGLTIYRVPLVPRGKGSRSRLFINYLSFILTSVTFGCWRVRGMKFDIVFVYGTSPILQCLTGIFFRYVKKAPLVLWIQDLWPDSLSATGYIKNRLILSGVGAIVSWIYRRCDLLLSQSLGFVESIKARAPEVPIVYFPNPGDVLSGPALDSADQIQLPAGFNLLFAGNVGSVQALETIVEAAERLRHIPKANFLILGSGSRSAWLSREICLRSLQNVSLLGRVELAVAIDAMRRSDALLVSLKDEEALNRTIPSKISTYLSAGRPIIASINGEGASVVTGSGAGIACEAENGEALAGCVLELMAMPREARDEMGAAGRRWYDNHLEINKLVQNLLGYFKALEPGRRALFEVNGHE